MCHSIDDFLRHPFIMGGFCIYMMIYQICHRWDEEKWGQFEKMSIHSTTKVDKKMDNSQKNRGQYRSLLVSLWCSLLFVYDWMYYEWKQVNWVNYLQVLSICHYFLLDIFVLIKRKRWEFVVHHISALMLLFLFWICKDAVLFIKLVCFMEWSTVFLVLKEMDAFSKKKYWAGIFAVLFLTIRMMIGIPLFWYTLWNTSLCNSFSEIYRHLFGVFPYLVLSCLHIRWCNLILKQIDKMFKVQ